MLILERKPEETLIIDQSLVIRILKVQGDAVKLGFEGPNLVVRGEIADADVGPGSSKNAEKLGALQAAGLEALAQGGHGETCELMDHSRPGPEDRNRRCDCWRHGLITALIAAGCDRIALAKVLDDLD